MSPVPAAHPFSLQAFEQYHLSSLVFDYHSYMVILGKGTSSQHPIIHTLPSEQNYIPSLRRIYQLSITYAPNLPEHITRRFFQRTGILLEMEFEHAAPSIKHRGGGGSESEVLCGFVLEGDRESESQVVMVAL